MDAYAIVRDLHFGIGVLAFASYWTAGAARKGSTLHRYAGRVFLLAMCGILASGAWFVVAKLAGNRPVSAGFLFYLLVITSTAMWTAWRAPRDKRDYARYTGPVYRGLAWGSILSAAGSLALGAMAGAMLLMVFSVVGFFVGYDMLKKVRATPATPRWWMIEHGEGMIGCGIATHVAFVAIALPKLHPAFASSNLSLAAWIAPVVVALIARRWLHRRYGASAHTVGPSSKPAQKMSPVAGAVASSSIAPRS